MKKPPLFHVRLRCAVGMAPLLLALAVPSAFAEGPMATDDAGTLDVGGMKVEAALGRDDKARSAELGFGYGLIENVEIGLSFGWLRCHHGTADGDQSGFRQLGLWS